MERGSNETGRYNSRRGPAFARAVIWVHSVQAVQFQDASLTVARATYNLKQAVNPRKVIRSEW